MAYIVQRKDRFYVVDYPGIDLTTGRERRRWNPAGHARTDAEAIKARLEAVDHAEQVVVAEQLTLGRYLTERWMPRRRQRLAPTTAHRYQWMIDNYIEPALAALPPRPSMTCTSSSAPRSPTLNDSTSWQPTSPMQRSHPAPRPENGPARSAEPLTNSPSS